MEKSVLTIVKGKDDWKFTVEIKETAKGEVQVSVKARSDGSITTAGSEALREYKRIREELTK